MLCPIDGYKLLIVDRKGIEIDYCPKCRGVWLDRGELDKLIEYEIRIEESWVSKGAVRYNHASPSKHSHDDEHPQDKRISTFLEDIFDDLE